MKEEHISKSHVFLYIHLQQYITSYTFPSYILNHIVYAPSISMQTHSPRKRSIKTSLGLLLYSLPATSPLQTAPKMYARRPTTVQSEDTLVSVTSSRGPRFRPNDSDATLVNWRDSQARRARPAPRVDSVQQPPERRSWWRRRWRTRRRRGWLARFMYKYVL